MMKELQEKVISWAHGKNLSPKRQIFKVDEESGELAGAILKKNREKIIDSIGDTLVTLIILAEQLEIEIDLEKDIFIPYLPKSEIEVFKPLTHFMAEKAFICSDIYAGRRVNKSGMVDAIGCIFLVAYHLDLDVAYCLEVAYNVIAGRKGATIDGVFVKEEGNE